MIITRHNYEEFFLLYVDRELDEDQRIAVENFVSQNPDLAKELEMLQQAILADNTMEFQSKELLYKKENSISLSNYEEYFLLYTDNELNKPELEAVENFVLKHPQLQNEFTILQKTRLHPEVIAFANKEALYRKETKVRRIIPLGLVRVGAAAAIIAIAYISFIKISSSNVADTNGVVTVSKRPTQIVVEKAADTAQELVTERPIVAVDVRRTNSNNINKKHVNNIKQLKINTRKVTKTESNEEQVAVNITDPKREIEIIEQPLAIVETPINPTKPSDKMTQNTISSMSDGDLINAAERNNSITDQPLAQDNKPLITHAVYLETDNIEEEKTLYIGSREINKNKLKGIFKKAVVFLDKRLRRNEE